LRPEPRPCALLLPASWHQFRLAAFPRRDNPSCDSMQIYFRFRFLFFLIVGKCLAAARANSAECTSLVRATSWWRAIAPRQQSLRQLLHRVASPTTRKQHNGSPLSCRYPYFGGKAAPSVITEAALD
jgi:hypothetical protein